MFNARGLIINIYKLHNLILANNLDLFTKKLKYLYKNNKLGKKINKKVNYFINFEKFKKLFLGLFLIMTKN